VTGVRQALLLLLVVLAAGCNTKSGGGTASITVAAVPPQFAFAPTRRCLLAKGALVSRLRAESGRLRELAGFAQRTSFAVRLRRRTVALAFGNAELLAELLAVPDNPYRIEVISNALLMFLPHARAQAAEVRSCLRS
jgi:hypothetical protein